ncbi:ribosome maturation factor RimP [Endozoicomonas sp.]|uniref:ribosome maturation factor RimP n=1 Tax=Endozoicomonas sp. TaxID=1892382 RepID=UPI00288448F8|nr:ribosome maturation factor RimP [Endozoicomonas sp.]
MAGKQSQLEALIEPIVESLDYRLWGIEFVSRGRNSMLRVYIDADSGIALEDCEKVSRQVSAVMDVEDPIADEYTLEVSSPGLDRPLFRLEQYEMMAGYRVNIRLRVPFEGRRKYQGVIKGIEGQDVVIEADGHELLLPVDSIDKAQVIPQFD